MTVSKKPPQFSHKQELPKYDPHALLDNLFERAKAKDEFEFCCTILRVRGMENAGWDPLQESLTLINQLITFLQSPLEDSFNVRLSLLLYCHITEMPDLYNIIGNLLRILKGERHSSGKAANYPQSKVIRMKEWADEQGLEDLGDMFTDMLVKEVRNAFSHSGYILQQESFNIRGGDGVKIGNLIDPKVKMQWLMPR